MPKQYGTFAVVVKEPETPEEMRNAVKLCINKLIDGIQLDKFDPDWNTLKIIIHEGIDIFSGLDWDENEENDYEPSLPQWRMTVGIKFEEKRKTARNYIDKCKDLTV